MTNCKNNPHNEGKYIHNQTWGHIDFNLPISCTTYKKDNFPVLKLKSL